LGADFYDGIAFTTQVSTRTELNLAIFRSGGGIGQDRRIDPADSPVKDDVAQGISEEVSGLGGFQVRGEKIALIAVVVEVGW